MTAEEVDDTVEASVVRALIVPRGKNGSTLEQIKSELNKNKKKLVFNCATFFR